MTTGVGQWEIDNRPYPVFYWAFPDISMEIQPILFFVFDVRVRLRHDDVGSYSTKTKMITRVIQGDYKLFIALKSGMITD